MKRLALPITFAAWVSGLFTLYKVFVGEKASVPASFTGLCLLAMLYLLAKAKDLARWEAQVVGLSIFSISSIGVFSALHGAY